MTQNPAHAKLNGWDQLGYGCLNTHDTLTVYIESLFIFSAFQTEGKLYLILDFLRGGDLFTRLSKEVRIVLSMLVTSQMSIHFVLSVACT